MRWPSSVVIEMLGNKVRVASWGCGIVLTSNDLLPGTNCFIAPLTALMMGGTSDSTICRPGRGSLYEIDMNSFGNGSRALVKLSSAFQVGSLPVARKT